MRPTRARSLFRLASWVAMVMLWTAPHAVSAFETDWTRIWTTNHDGDDPIEKELLTRLAHAKGRVQVCSIFHNSTAVTLASALPVDGVRNNEGATFKPSTLGSHNRSQNHINTSLLRIYKSFYTCAEESLDSESTFCSARYYKPLVHKSGYGNQVSRHHA
jgi:hypothetical protein